MTTPEKRLLQLRLPGGSEKHIVMVPDGLPVSQESIYLAEFVLESGITIRSGVDLGTGSGLLALLLGAAIPAAIFTGIDIQEDLVVTARSNTRLNQLENRVTFQHGDIRSADDLPEHYSQDLVIANPPFRKLNTGRISPDPNRSVACHEVSATLSDYIRSGALILKDRGVFALVTLPERLMEVLSLLSERRLEPCNLRFVHHTMDYPASAVLILARKNGRGGLMISPPLVACPD